MARAPKTYYYYYFEARVLTLKPLSYYYENGALRLERFRLDPQSLIIII
jgi:hypothetical protein